jgi:hypothetical protein
MAEAAEKKPAEAKTGEKKAKKGPSASEMLKAEKKNKIAWTLERCQKVARRFSSEQEWAANAPAAYKSASSHGWVAQCTGKMGGKTSSVRSLKKSA